MAATWGSLSDKEKKMFGNSKTTFQQARTAAGKAGASQDRSKSIRNFIPKSTPNFLPPSSSKPAPRPTPTPAPTPVSYTHLTLPTIYSV